MKKSIFIILLFFIFFSCSNENNNPISVSNEDYFVKTITLLQNESFVLNDSTTLLNHFNEVDIKSDDIFEIICNYGDVDLNLTRFCTKDVTFVNIKLINNYSVSMTVTVKLK